MVFVDFSNMSKFIESRVALLLVMGINVFICHYASSFFSQSFSLGSEIYLKFFIDVVTSSHDVLQHPILEILITCGKIILNLYFTFFSV